jgi:hypothetical protein
MALFIPLWEEQFRTDMQVSTIYENEQECFIRCKTRERSSSVLNGLKNDPYDEFIGEVILKINIV